MEFIKIVPILLLISSITACSSRAEREFTQGCRAGGASSSECSCVYDKMKEHYPKEVMETFGAQGWNMPRDFSDVMVDSALQCRATN